MTTFTEAVVEQAALAWLESLGWQVLLAPDPAPPLASAPVRYTGPAPTFRHPLWGGE